LGALFDFLTDFILHAFFDAVLFLLFIFLFMLFLGALFDFLTDFLLHAFLDAVLIFLLIFFFMLFFLGCSF
jgi:hypothetical protein